MADAISLLRTILYLKPKNDASVRDNEFQNKAKARTCSWQQPHICIHSDCQRVVLQGKERLILVVVSIILIILVLLVLET